MPFQPTGDAVLALFAGAIDSTAFLVGQVNQSGQLDLYLQKISGSPQLLFSTIPQLINYDIGLMTGQFNSFKMSGGFLTARSQEFEGGFGINMPLGGQTAIGWWGPEASGGFYNHGYIPDGNPYYRNRFENEDSEVLLEYNHHIGGSIKVNNIFGARSEYALPGNMSAYVGNAYNTNSWDASIVSPSSQDGPVSDTKAFWGTTFLTWNGISDLRRNFTIFPSYIELGGSVVSDDPYVDLGGGRGALVIRNTPTAPSIGHPDGLTIFSDILLDGRAALSMVDSSGNRSQLFPSIKNVEGISVGYNAYVPITSSRVLTDDDIGKILYTNTGSYTLTVPAGLYLPFQCSIKCEGTGTIRFTGAGGTNVRNAYNHYRTAGQWTTCGLDWRDGTDCVLFGDTVL